MRLCRALHHSDERERERATNITDLSVNASRPLHTLLGLYPVFWDMNSLVVKSATQQQPLLESLTPREASTRQS